MQKPPERPPFFGLIERVGALDGLRGIAIGLVMLSHFVAADPSRGILHRITSVGGSGVDLFFALSGFLIGTILLRNRTSPRLVPVFILRRSLRILPLYFVTLGVLAAKTYGLPGDWAPLWVYFVFGTNIWVAVQGFWHFMPFGATWTLAVEEQFYLLAPWCVRLVRQTSLGPLIGVACALPCLLRWLSQLTPSHYPLAPHVLTPFRADGFACGMLIAWATTTADAWRFRAWLRRNWRIAAIPPLVGVTAMVLCVLAGDDGHRSHLLWGYTSLAVGSALVIFAIIDVGPPRLIALLEFRPLRHLGRHAYFIYLWHPIMIVVLERRLLPHAPANTAYRDIIVPLVMMCVTWGAATLSWRWFEGPIVKFGHRFSYSPADTAKPAPVATPA